MPIYVFKCFSCGEESRKLAKRDSKLVCDCGSELERQLPTELSSEILEMRDRYRGVQLPKNQEAKVKKRFRENHDKYELAEKIDRQGIDTADRLGWTKKK